MAFNYSLVSIKKQSHLLVVIFSCIVTLASFTASATSTVTSIVGHVSAYAATVGGLDQEEFDLPAGAYSWSAFASASSSGFTPPTADPNGEFCQFIWPGHSSCRGLYESASAGASLGIDVALTGDKFNASGDLYGGGSDYWNTHEYDIEAVSQFEVTFVTNIPYNFVMFGDGYSPAKLTGSDGVIFSGLGSYNHSGILEPGAYIFSVSAYIGFYGGEESFNATLDLVNPVPIPAAIWLFGSGLIGLIGFARRKANA